MIETRLAAGEGLVLLGAVRGFVPDAETLLDRLNALAPGAIGLSTSPDELDGIREYFGSAPAEPLVPLAPAEVAELRALSRYGEVRVPNPSFTRALAWGRAHGVPVEGVDPSDERFAELFTGHISYFELVRRTVRERGLIRRPPAPDTADDFALVWAGALNRSGGSASLATVRDLELARAARDLAARTRGPTAVVVDRERFDGVALALAGADPSRVPTPRARGSG